MDNIKQLSINAHLDPNKTESTILKYYRYKDVLIDLVKNTKYYTVDDILNGIQDSLISWNINRKNIPLYCFLHKSNKGSSVWLYRENLKFIPEHKKLYDITDLEKYINQEIEILYIDDWALSGIHLAGTFEELYPLLNYGNNLYKNNKIKYTFITFINTIESELLLHSLFDLYNINGSLISTHQLHPFITDKYDNKLIKEIHDQFAPDAPFHNKLGYAVHLEYKVSNQFGTLELFYLKCRDVVNNYYF